MEKRYDCRCLEEARYEDTDDTRPNSAACVNRRGKRQSFKTELEFFEFFGSRNRLPKGDNYNTDDIIRHIQAGIDEDEVIIKYNCQLLYLVNKSKCHDLSIGNWLKLSKDMIHHIQSEIDRRLDKNDEDNDDEDKSDEALDEDKSDEDTDDEALDEDKDEDNSDEALDEDKDEDTDDEALDEDKDEDTDDEALDEDKDEDTDDEALDEDKDEDKDEDTDDEALDEDKDEDKSDEDTDDESLDEDKDEDKSDEDTDDEEIRKFADYLEHKEEMRMVTCTKQAIEISKEWTESQLIAVLEDNGIEYKKYWNKTKLQQTFYENYTD